MKPPRQRIRTILLYAITTLITLVVLFPVIFGFFTSFKPNTEIFTYPPSLLPQQWTVQPYTSVLTQQRYLRYFLNGYLISISSTLFRMSSFIASTSATLITPLVLFGHSQWP